MGIDLSTTKGVYSKHCLKKTANVKDSNYDHTSHLTVAIMKKVQ